MKKSVVFFLVTLLLSSGCTTTKIPSSQTAQLTITSYNLRMDTPNDKEDAWPNRKEMVKSIFTFYDWDICGTQEGFKHQLDGILELNNYSYIGVGRDDGVDAGEHSAIIYKKDKFTVLDKGNFWFSQTPEVPSKGWDATCCNRICSWGKFLDKTSGKSFFVFNVHYDHQGREARRESSKLLLKRIKSIAGASPVFVTGDFNASPSNEPIQIIYNDGLLADSKQIVKSKPFGTNGTFNSFKVSNASNERIDYVWVSKNISVQKYGVINHIERGHFPSDHFPVMVVAEF